VQSIVKHADNQSLTRLATFASRIARSQKLRPAVRAI